MKIFNGTAHEITIYSIDDCDQTDPRRLVLKDGAKPVYTIAAGKPLNAVKVNKKFPDGDFPFPVAGAVVFESADPIPDADVVICSNLYRAACVHLRRDTSRLATIDGAVYDSTDSPRPVGCLRLAIG